jgi:hypothetical protein
MPFQLEQAASPSLMMLLVSPLLGCVELGFSLSTARGGLPTRERFLPEISTALVEGHIASSQCSRYWNLLLRPVQRSDMMLKFFLRRDPSLILDSSIDSRKTTHPQNFARQDMVSMVYSGLRLSDLEIWGLVNSLLLDRVVFFDSFEIPRPVGRLWC